MEHGDLVFIQMGSAANAISAVTEGHRGARVNHVGVAVETARGLFILEAFYPEVRLTHVDVYLRRSTYQSTEARYMVGRLRAPHRHLIPGAVAYGLRQRAIPYDRLYLTDEDALYCSELVVDMFKAASQGQPFFPEQPMRFTDTDTGEIHPYWVAHYGYFGMAVPVGEPGSNPGDLSLDPKLEIVEVAGPLTGLV